MPLPRFSPRQVATGVGLYVAAAVGGYLYLRSAKAPAPSPCGCGSRHGGAGTDVEGAGAAEGDNQATFDRLADQYDSLIAADETFMGLKLMRRWLMRNAEGDVLEVSAGTGRNLDYYPLARLRSLTLTDTSRHMLVNAADKYRALAAAQGGAAAQLPVRFELADAQRLAAPAGGSSAGSAGSSSSAGSNADGSQATSSQATRGSSSESGGSPAAPATPRHQGEAPAPALRPALRELRTFPRASFDVVVDTFGLCSQQDPVTALKEMARVCKPGGRILLLQHGRGSWGFINRILDNGAGEHFKKWGCWWNRDIGQIVRQAGLRVESESRWHFGTTYLVIASPPAGGSL